VDLLIYRKDSLMLNNYYSFQEDDEYLIQMRRIWQEKLSEGFAAMPQLNNFEAKLFPNTAY
jgi:putative proteasome-type protease